MRINDLSEHILAVAHKEVKSITNLQLQKVLFFTIGMSIRRDQNEYFFFEGIYNNDFEKWQYGPVVPSLYFKFNKHGDRNIETTGEYNKALTRFDHIIDRLLDIDVFRLVALSHSLKSWSRHEKAILEGKRLSPYTLEEIARDFNEA